MTSRLGTGKPLTFFYSVRSSSHSSPIRFHRGGGGLPPKRRGGFSGPYKPDTGGPSYLTIEYTSQGFQINFQMRWITRERAYPAVQVFRNFKAFLPSFSSLWLRPSLVSATICSRPLISVSSCSSSFWAHYFFIRNSLANFNAICLKKCNWIINLIFRDGWLGTEYEREMDGEKNL